MFQQNIRSRGSPQTSRHWLSLPAAVLLILSASYAYAAEYYVATTGNDNNPGTLAAPWKTVKHAAQRMKAGDTTYVRGGVYREKSIQFSGSGTSSAPIKLIGYENEFPVLQGDGTSSGIILTSRSGITIEGFEITNYKAAINFDTDHGIGAYDLVIRRNLLHHNTAVPNAPMLKSSSRHSYTIVGVGQRILVDRNRISQNGNFHECSQNYEHCNKDHGMYVHGPDWVVTNNIFDGNLGYGITIKDPSASDNITKNWLVANNTFVRQHYRAGVNIAGPNKNIRIENNIFYENAHAEKPGLGQGVEFTSASGASGISIRNNLSYKGNSGAGTFIRDGSNGPRVVEGVQYTQSDNIVNTANPNFAGDFNLQAGSPAIDKGLAISEVTWDHAGGKRPFGAAFDIGAYESGAPPGSGSSPPNPTSSGGIPANGSTSMGGLGNCLK